MTTPPPQPADAGPAEAIARIAVIGGSGLYDLFDDARTHDVPTPYGETSSPVTVGEIAGRPVAFLTRHGREHALPPHRIPYRANIWALKSLGVEAIVSSSAVGSVDVGIPPGGFAVPDQLFDRTSGRADTFFDEGGVEHLPAADTFDPILRDLAIAALAERGVPVAERATAVVIQGPRFSTRAESQWYASFAHLVNMTLLPEVTLAAELGIGTVNLSFVTDVDAGVPGRDETPVTAEAVFARLREAQPVIRQAIADLVVRIPEDYAPRQLIAPSSVARVMSAQIRAARA